MENGFFEYEVEYFNEFLIDEQHPYGQMKTVYGVTYAATYAEAICNIEKYYDRIEKINITGLEPFSAYEFNGEDNNFKVEITKGID